MVCSLHDVGKLAVHPDILNKEGSLSDEEWELVRQHPIEGKLTAPLAAWLGPWSATIREHHERYDGSGYPYGLAGASISLGGRIVRGRRRLRRHDEHPFVQESVLARSGSHGACQVRRNAVRPGRGACLPRCTGQESP